MKRAADFWLQVRHQFDPQEVLTGRRGKTLYIDRPESPERNLRRLFQPQASPTLPPKVLLTGHRGCGKTSLLIRLLEHFKQHDYFLVYFDITHNLDKEQFTHIDLLYLIGGAIYRIAERERLKPTPDLFTDLARAVYTVVYQEKEKVKDETLNAVELVKNVICFGAKMLGSTLGEQLAEAMLKPVTITTGVSEEVSRKRETQPQVQHIIDCVNRLIGDVESKAGKFLLLVVDSLDKIARPDLADLLFVESRALLGPACRVLYTAPMSLYKSFPRLKQDYRDYLSVPNVKLWDRKPDPAPNLQGYQTMREVVDRRLQSVVSSTTDFIAPAVLDLLIAYSGGVMRWLVTLFHNAALEAQNRNARSITMEMAEEAVFHEAASFQLSCDKVVLNELWHVKRHREISGSMLSRTMLSDQRVLAYTDGEERWCAVHPFLHAVINRTVRGDNDEHVTH